MQIGLGKAVSCVQVLLIPAYPLRLSCTAFLKPLCVQIDMEERFCERVKQMGCTCVTISHRPALVAFHDLVLALDGEGGWALHRGVNSGHAGEEDSQTGILPFLLTLHIQ